MSAFYLILGIILLVVAIIDFLWTTLWVSGGAGPLTDRTASFLWTSMKKVSGTKHKLLSLSGPLTLIIALFMWIALIWAGWTFIFAVDANSITDTQDNNPISWGERVYFAGYLIFTLGNGDYSPDEGIWQFTTALAAGSGLLFITLGITYLLSVLGAVTQKHALAKSINGLGNNGVDIVINSWNGKDFRDIDLLLNSFSSQLSTISSQHNAYPVLHYYHAEEANKALPLAVTALDEALTILQYGVPERSQPNKALLKDARSSVQNFLEALKSSNVRPSENRPPLIDLHDLRIAGLPTVSEEQFLSSLSELQKRRRSLLGGLEDNNYEWPEKK